MDLRLEAAAASELAENFAADEGFRVPRVDWQRTARRVLTLERVSGIASDERDALIAAGFDPDRILATRRRDLLQAGVPRRLLPRRHAPRQHLHRRARAIWCRSTSASWAGSTGRPGAISARCCSGFLSADYQRVADVHFAAGYVPANQDKAAFMQACRAIAEPIRGRPLAEISVGRLLGQLFEVSETFAMETQPQLLLLQKTMVVAEGVGRALNPELNMWQLAQPLIEDWIAENLGPQAQLRTRGRGRPRGGAPAAAAGRARRAHAGGRGRRRHQAASDRRSRR